MAGLGELLRKSPDVEQALTDPNAQEAGYQTFCGLILPHIVDQFPGIQLISPDTPLEERNGTNPELVRTKPFLLNCGPTGRDLTSLDTAGRSRKDFVATGTRVVLLLREEHDRPNSIAVDYVQFDCSPQSVEIRRGGFLGSDRVSGSDIASRIALKIAKSIQKPAKFWRPVSKEFQPPPF